MLIFMFCYVKIDVNGFPRFKLSTSKGFSPSVTSVKASPDAAWQEALSLLVSKMTPQNGEPLSRLFRVHSDDSSSTDEETEAIAFLEASVHGTEHVPVEVPITIANTTKAATTAIVNAVTVNATDAVPIATANATGAIATATVNPTANVPTATVNATKVPVDIPPLLPIPEIPEDHTRVWAESTFGLELFGLQCSTVRRLIEGLPNAEQAKVRCCPI